MRQRRSAVPSGRISCSQLMERSLDQLIRSVTVTLESWSKLFKIMPMKVRILALDAMGNVTWFMKMQSFTTLIAYQRP